MLENLIFAVLLMGAAVAALHYVILISSCGKWQRDLLHQWSCAIESWTKARRELRHANTSLRRAARTLEKAERRTTDGSARLAGTTDPEAEKTDATILRFKNEKESAREAVQASAKRVHNERLLLDTAGNILHDTARQVVTSWRDMLRTITQKWLSQIRDFIGGIWQTCKSVIAWVAEHRLAASVLSVVVVVPSNYSYYAIFDFNVLPYYSEAPVDNLATLVLAVVAVALFALLLSLALMVLICGFGLVVRIVALLPRTVAFVLAQSSLRILVLCCRSPTLGQLTLLSVSAWSSSLARGWTFVSGIGTGMGGLFRGAIARVANGWFAVVKQIAKTVTIDNAFQIGGAMLFALVLLYFVAIDPQYRAYDVCRDDTQVRIVVNQPPENGAESMIRIGSTGNYVFAVSDETCDSRNQEGDADTNESAESNGSDTGAPSDGAVFTMLKRVLQRAVWGRIQFVGSGQSPWPWSRDDTDATPDSQAPRIAGAVVALPISRVHCVYDGRLADSASPLCEYPTDTPQPVIVEVKCVKRASTARDCPLRASDDLETTPVPSGGLESTDRWDRDDGR